VNRLAPRDRDIAMVFQDYALYPQMSVRENLAFGLKMRKMPRDEIDRRVRRAAETLDIGSLLERKPAALSGGQRQRVALGRALVREPAAFLMDEPLSNLDAKLRVQTRSEIKRLQEEVGTTTVYVTHDQVEAMTMGDRVAVMNEGILEQVGEPPDRLHHPGERVRRRVHREPVDELRDDAGRDGRRDADAFPGRSLARAPAGAHARPVGRRGDPRRAARAHAAVVGRRRVARPD
jgi:ABC-type sugar transport system ATPase subunit